MGTAGERSGPDVLAIVGPTASGKSELAVAVARRLDGEVVSMDSRQIYRGMDVGTAKLPPAERHGVPHHGLDLVNPDRAYSAGRFAQDARRWIGEIRDRGRAPILVGGTGFFLRALTQPIFGEPALDAEARRALRAWLAGRPREELIRWVERLDPGRAAVAAQGGPQRLTRTLEIALLTGRPLTWWHRSAPGPHQAVRALVVRLDVDRAELDARIAARARRMLASGLVDEVRALLAAGYGPGAPGMSGVGYREIALHLAGAIDLAEAEARIVKATRAYARRQVTWFRNQLGEGVLALDASAPPAARIERVVRAWDEARAGALPGRGAVA